MSIERLNLKKLNNTRDLGGLPAEGGKEIRRGKLIRSGKIYRLPESTVNKLKAIGVTTIVDMRTDREREEYPQTFIENIRYVHLPLTYTATAGITREKSSARTMLEESKRIKSEFGTAENYMLGAYETILFDKHSVDQLKRFFDVLLKEDGCVLWHCSAGKDRTGLAAMLVEAVLGVDEKHILEDYVISDVFQKRKRGAQKIGLRLSPVPRRFKQILYAQMAAKPQYILGAMKEIKARYGSVKEYCKQVLELTDEEINLLKEKYLK